MSLDRQQRMQKNMERNQPHDGPFPHIEPADAASLIILDQSHQEPKVLMGKRHMRHKFMPGFYVFPGGRLEESDQKLTSVDEFDEAALPALLTDIRTHASPERVRAIGLAAIRETYEETGVVIGRPDDSTAEISTAENETDLAPIWQSYYGYNVCPPLSAMQFIARAITPPHRTRRYDTRFFCISADYISHQSDTIDGELEELCWLSFAEARTKNIATVTDVILEDLEERLNHDGSLNPSLPIPFYYTENGIFLRTLIPNKGA